MELSQQCAHPFSDTSFGGPDGGHLPPPLIKENSDFLYFAYNFFFLYFAPP